MKAEEVSNRDSIEELPDSLFWKVIIVISTIISIPINILTLVLGHTAYILDKWMVDIIIERSLENKELFEVIFELISSDFPYSEYSNIKKENPEWNNIQILKEATKLRKQKYAFMKESNQVEYSGISSLVLNILDIYLEIKYKFKAIYCNILIQYMSLRSFITLECDYKNLKFILKKGSKSRFR